MTSFLHHYVKTLCESCGSFYQGNYEPHLYDESQEHHPGLRQRVSLGVSRILASVGLVRTRALLPLAEGGVRFVQPCLSELEWLYAHLADQESRDLLVSLMAFRVLGHQRVKLAYNRPAYWANIRRMEEYACNAESIDVSFQGSRLRKMDLRPFGVPVTLFAIPAGVWGILIEEQYRCVMADGAAIQACEGDVAIDAGACWGDTALYFAAKVGPSGRVFSCEFLPRNLKVFRSNLDLNPHLKDRVVLVERAIWSSSDQTLFLRGDGPVTRVNLRPSVSDEPSIETLSIDDLVVRHGLTRLDFIKMDIEGSEMPALRGAERSLRRFRPKLAISVYHNLEDFWSVPQFLDAMGLCYRFFLRHSTISVAETVLFAVRT